MDRALAIDGMFSASGDFAATVWVRFRGNCARQSLVEEDVYRDKEEPLKQ